MVCADLRARRAIFGATPVQRPVADQVADVGRDPVGAGLDELVVVELLEIFLENTDLPVDEGEQLAERFALLGVANAVDRRQQVIEPIGIVTHGITSRAIGAGSRVSSSAAPNDAGSPPLGRLASSRAFNFTS